MADVRKRLADARLYLCTDRRGSPTALAAFVDTVCAAGVDVVQLREKGLEAADEIAALTVIAEAAGRHGALWAVNDRADIAATVQAPVLHLGQADLPVAAARQLVGDEMIIGQSTHSIEQFDRAAADLQVDYLCAGPVWETPTKPGRPAAGLQLVGQAASRSPRQPWFAIGGIHGDRTATVRAAGATRVVVVRAITAADDPGAAVRSLVAALTQR